MSFRSIRERLACERVPDRGHHQHSRRNEAGRGRPPSRRGGRPGRRVDRLRPPAAPASPATASIAAAADDEAEFGDILSTSPPRPRQHASFTISSVAPERPWQGGHHRLTFLPPCTCPAAVGVVGGCAGQCVPTEGDRGSRVPPARSRRQTGKPIPEVAGDLGIHRGRCAAGCCGRGATVRRRRIGRWPSHRPAAVFGRASGLSWSGRGPRPGRRRAHPRVGDGASQSRCQSVGVTDGVDG